MAEKVREEEHGVPIAFGTKDKKKKEQLLKVMGEKVREVEHDVPIAFDTKYKKGIEHLSKGEDIEYDVSIIYAREDKKEVKQLSKDLAGQGVTCMLVEIDPLLGIEEKDMIPYTLKQSRSVLLYITTHYLQHYFLMLQAERIMQEAMSQQKQVIPVYGDITSEEQRKLPFPSRHLIPIDSRKEGFLKHLSMGIKEPLGGTGEKYMDEVFIGTCPEISEAKYLYQGQKQSKVLRHYQTFEAHGLSASHSTKLHTYAYLHEDVFVHSNPCISSEGKFQGQKLLKGFRPFWEVKSHGTKLHTDEDVIFRTKPGISSEGKFQGKKLSKGGYSGLHELQGSMYPDSPTIEPQSPGSDKSSDTEILNDLSSLFSEVASDDFISGDLSEDAALSQEDTIKEKGDLELALILSGIYIQKFTMDHHGGYVHLKEVGVTLVVPWGSLPEGTVMEMYLGVSWRPGDSPHLGGKQARTSPIVVIGPHGLTFQKPVYLSFPHCIPHVDDEKTEKKFWTSKTDLLETCKWTSDENDPVVIYSQTRCTAVLWNLCKYTTSSTKRKMLAAAFGLFDRGTDLLRIYVKCISDTPDETKVLESWMARNHLKGTIVPDGNFDLYICPHSHDDQGDGDQGNGDQGDGDQGNGDQGDGDQGNGDQGDGDQGNGDQGDGDQGNGDQGDGDQGNGEQGDGDQGNGDQGDGDHDNNDHVVCKDNHDVLVSLKDYQGWTLTGEDKKALDYQRMIDDSRPCCTFSLNPEPTKPCPKVFTSKILVAQQGLKGRDARLSSVELDVCCPLHEITKVPGTEQLNIQTLQLSHPDSSLIGENRAQVSEPLQQQSVMNPLVSHQAQWSLPAPGTSEPLQQQSVMNLTAESIFPAPQQVTSSSALGPSSVPVNKESEAYPIVETPSQLELNEQQQQFKQPQYQLQCQQQQHAQLQQFLNLIPQQRLPNQQTLYALSHLYGRPGLDAGMETAGQPTAIFQYIGCLEIHQNGDQELMAAAPSAHVRVLQRYLPLGAKANLDRIFKIPGVWKAIVLELRLENDCCPKEPVEFVFGHLQCSFQLLIWLLRRIGERVKEIVEPSDIEIMIEEVRKARIHEVECENLRKHLPYIAANGSDIESLLDFLFSKSIINDSDMEKIKCQQTSSKKWSLLLHKVLKCPADKDPVRHLRDWFVDVERSDLADCLAVKPEDVQESYRPDEAPETL